jgi:hemoglobin-like flavoprotein
MGNTTTTSVSPTSQLKLRHGSPPKISAPSDSNVNNNNNNMSGMGAQATPQLATPQKTGQTQQSRTALATSLSHADADTSSHGCLPTWFSGRQSTAPTAINSSRIISSWIKILSLTEDIEGGPSVAGIIIFQRTFFATLKHVDTDGEVYRLLCMCQNSANKSHRSPEALLFVIVRFLVSVTEKSPEMVTKLRSLGRFHQRRLITREHVQTFKRALYVTVGSLLGLKNSSPLMQDWMFLTEFVFSEMYKYEYVFSPRRNFSDVDTDGYNPDSVTLAVNESNNTILNMSRSSDNDDNDINLEVAVFSQNIVQLHHNKGSPGVVENINLASDSRKLFEEEQVAVDDRLESSPVVRGANEVGAPSAFSSAKSSSNNSSRAVMRGGSGWNNNNEGEDQDPVVISSSQRSSQRSSAHRPLHPEEQRILEAMFAESFPSAARDQV